MTGRSGEPPVEVAAAVLVEGNRVLVARRTDAQAFPGMWEFPGGKLEPGEDAARALARELREELAIETRALGPYAEVRYRGDRGRDVHVAFLRTERVSGEPRTVEVAEIRWADAAALGILDFVPSNREVAARLAGELSGAPGEVRGPGPQHPRSGRVR